VLAFSLVAIGGRISFAEISHAGFLDERQYKRSSKEGGIIFRGHGGAKS
jgi:hypothetical protein